MSGSSTIMQALLPAASGETVKRGSSFKNGDQSFAAVFKKNIQVRQEKATLPVTVSNVKDRQRIADDRRENVQTAEPLKKTDKPVVKNPAKEKMKELAKKAKDTLEAMQDPKVTPEHLKELAKELKSTLEEIKALVDSMDKPKTAEETANTAATQTAASIIPMVSPADAAAQADTAVPTSESEESVGFQQVSEKEQWDNRQASELKANPILKDFEKVLETQSELISNDPELKVILQQALAEIKGIQAVEVAKPEVHSPNKLEDLFAKLNGIVMKPETEKVDPGNDAKESSLQEVSASTDTAILSPADTDSAAGAGSQDQQSDQSQNKQVYAGENPAAQAKGTDGSDQAKTTPGKQAATLEKIDAAPSKPATQGPQQAVQNPQAFQETLEAVKDGVQAKNQFQSRIMEQVIETVKLNFRADDGKSEMIMKLKPESLGNVALKLSIDKGIVLAEFQVESQAVKQALESNLQDLRNALQDKGFNVFELDVSVRKDNQQHQNSDTDKGSKNRTARLESPVEHIERRRISLESVHRESTFDYLG